MEPKSFLPPFDQGEVDPAKLLYMTAPEVAAGELAFGLAHLDDGTFLLEVVRVHASGWGLAGDAEAGSVHDVVAPDGSRVRKMSSAMWAIFTQASVEFREKRKHPEAPLTGPRPNPAADA